MVVLIGRMERYKTSAWMEHREEPRRNPLAYGRNPGRMPHVVVPCIASHLASYTESSETELGLDSEMIEKPEYGDKYHLVWRKPGTKNVAYVRNYRIDAPGERRIPILLDDDLMQSINMRFLVSTWKDTGPAIYVSTAFLNLPRALGEPGIWHEVGHVHYEHLLHIEYHDQKQLRAARMSAIEKGNVFPMEEQADNFAVIQSGKEAMIGFLELILGTRPTGGKTGWNEIGRRELQIRIAAIRAFEVAKE